jgi:hypothetical protein
MIDLIGRIENILARTLKIDGAAVDGLSGVEDSVGYLLVELERHVHNVSRFWGSNGAATETNAIAATVAVPFVAVSGNDTWGTAVPICGTADDATDGLGSKHDPHFLFVVDTDHATPYRIRIIYGTGTSADAISAGQWSEEMFITGGGPFEAGVPIDFMMRRVDVGAKLWVQVWNATNGSNVDFYWGTHPYIG